MARTGIQYSDVARAATKLVADGKSPTVDSVRHTLGGTGSKSTIAPFLKRWKAEQEDTAVAEVTLPAPLLSAVRGLHEHMQAEFIQQREALEQQHGQALQRLEEQTKQLQADKDSALAAKAIVDEELTRTRQALTELQSRFHAQNVMVAALQAEQVGLQQRLTDRAAEIATLDSQLSQGREQFSHYQDATAAQRESDRREHEHRTVRYEHELTAASREIAGLQAALSQRNASFSALTLEHGNVQNELQTTREAMQTIQFANRRLVEQLAESAHTRDQVAAQVKELEQAVLEARLAAASQERETKIRADQLQDASMQIAALAQEKLDWVQERTILEQQLKAAKHASLAHDEGKN